MVLLQSGGTGSGMLIYKKSLENIVSIVESLKQSTCDENETEDFVQNSWLNTDSNPLNERSNGVVRRRGLGSSSLSADEAEFLEEIEGDLGEKESEYLRQLLKYESGEIDSLSLEKVTTDITSEVEDVLQTERARTRKWRYVSIFLGILSLILGLVNAISAI
jgi:hypothetical protein